MCGIGTFSTAQQTHIYLSFWVKLCRRESDLQMGLDINSLQSMFSRRSKVKLPSYLANALEKKRQERK